MSTKYNLYSTDGDLLAEHITADEFIICGHGRYFNYDGQTYYQQGFVPWGDNEVNLYGFKVPQTPLEVDQAIIDRGEACPRCGGAWYATDQGGLTLQHAHDCGHLADCEARDANVVM